MELEELCCPSCGQDMIDEFGGTKFPHGIWYCSDCEVVFVIKVAKVNFTSKKEIDEAFKEIGLGIDLIF